MWQLMNLFKRSSRSPRSAAGSRRSFKPALEALEDRQLPSSSGVISSITTDGGGSTSRYSTTLFAVGQDGRIWEGDEPGTYLSRWTPLSNPADGTFREVSAGLDASGQPHCYAINSGTGNLWEFDINQTVVHGAYLWVDHGQNVGGVCLDLSATVNNNCYVIGTDNMCYYYAPAAANPWTYVVSPSDGVLHISAGVNSWGADKVYMVDTYGYVLPADQDATGDWLRDAQGHYLRASLISAGIGSNSTGVDLYYTGRWDNSLHYFDGWTDTRLGSSYISQISASVDANGHRDCFVLEGSWCYKSLGSPGQFQEVTNAADQISAAKGDLLFDVEYTLITILRITLTPAT
jgi:hypothetical protein